MSPFGFDEGLVGFSGPLYAQIRIPQRTRIGNLWGWGGGRGERERMGKMLAVFLSNTAVFSRSLQSTSHGNKLV